MISRNYYLVRHVALFSLDIVVENAEVVRESVKNHTVVILTSGSCTGRMNIQLLLKGLDIPYDYLIMRSTTDTRTKDQFIEEWIDDIENSIGHIALRWGF